jgi:hypothetical protein
MASNQSESDIKQAIKIKQRKLSQQSNNINLAGRTFFGESKDTRNKTSETVCYIESQAS